MATTMTSNLFLFGDQAGNPFSVFRNLQKDRTDAERLFTTRASVFIRYQITCLPRPQVQGLPSFDNIYDLIDHLEKNDGRIHPAISSTLVTFIQLLQLYRYFAGCPPPNRLNKCHAIGLCIGALAASAFVSTDSIDDLDRLAIPILSIAFGIGLRTATTATSALPKESSIEKWSCGFINTTPEVIGIRLDQFHSKQPLSCLDRLYITAVTPTGVTVSGLPSLLRRFVVSLHDIEHAWLPIYGPYHMRHFHSPEAVDRVFDFVGSNDMTTLRTTKQKEGFSCSISWKTISNSSTFDLLREAVAECLMQPLRLDIIVSKCAQRITEGRSESLLILLTSPWNIGRSLATRIATKAQLPVVTYEVADYISDFKSTTGQNRADEPIAIVGMSGRFPGASNHEELWKILEEGLDLHRKIPEDRFDIATHVDPTGNRKNTSWTPYGCFLDHPGLFDAKFFGMSPREAMQTCTMQRLALVTAHEALEMSGFVPDRTPSTSLNRIGTFYGQTIDDYREVNAGQDIGAYFITGGIRAFGPGRINYHYKFTGPSFSIDTACSSSLASIQVACGSIWNGDCDTAIAGGMNILSNPDIFSGLSRGQYLSRTGNCKTFDKEADGYCRGDSVGSIVLKRLSDAELDGDTVLAVIRSIATNHNSNAASITRPHSSTQSALYRDILRKASLEPEEVKYIEMHGTGTQVGDTSEMSSVVEVFSPEHALRKIDNPLYVGSCKANIGHGEAASGISALIKSVLMLKKHMIPPHCGIKSTPNPNFPDIQGRNIRIPEVKTPLPDLKDKPITILVNNFSAAGGNTALILQDSPETADIELRDVRSTLPFTISANTEQSLKGNAERLIEYLDSHPQTDLGSLSYTTTARRMHQKLRHSFAASSIQEVKTSLTALVQRDKLIVNNHSDGVVFIFTGQGSLYRALGCQLFQSALQFRSEILEFDAIAQGFGFPSMISLLDGSKDINELSPTQVQVGVVCIQMALSHLLGNWGVKPEVTIGHSLGEYAAAHVAGIISARDTIFLVGTRASLLEKKCLPSTHSMLAVRESETNIRKLLNSFSFEITCINSPNDTVISSAISTIDDIHQMLQDLGIRSTKLPLQFAYHSAQVDPILKDLSDAASACHFEKPEIEYISSFLGRPLSVHDSIDAAYWVGHTRRTVKFGEALARAKEHIISNSTLFFEIGPHPTCLNMVKVSLGTQIIGLPTMRKNEDPWKTLSTSLAAFHDAGYTIDWSKFHMDFATCHKVLHLPSYAWDNKNYWQKYEGDWTLSKGDRTLQSTVSSPENPKFATTTLQRLISEDLKAETPVFVFESDLADFHLHAAATGHLVNGVGLFSSSIYADMAFTAAEYVYKQLNGRISLPCAEIMNMVVSRPLIVNLDRAGEDSTLRLTVSVNVESQTAEILFSSVVRRLLAKPIQHATGLVRYGNPQLWSSELGRTQHLVDSRTAALETNQSTHLVQRIGCKTAYRLFSNIVKYSPPYCGMKEVFLNTDGFEAAANITLSLHEGLGTFFQNPHWIDSLVHISGFVMNVNDPHDPSEYAYISQGWDSMRFCDRLMASNDYKVYVKMLPITDTMYGGDVWISRAGQAIGLIGNIKFQRISRAALDTLLPSATRHPVKSLSEGVVPTLSLQKNATRTDPLSPIEEGVMPVPLSTRESALEMICAELGVSSKDISLTDQVADLGIDSLMSLSIAIRIRESLALEIPSSIFLGSGTIDELLNCLTKHSEKLSNTTSYKNKFRETLDANMLKPSTNPGKQVSSLLAEKVESGYNSYESDESLPSSPPEYRSSPNELFLEIIAKEMGIAVSELQPEVNLSDIGMDSLMSLTIIAKLQEAMLDIPSNFFLVNPTVNRSLHAVKRLTLARSASINKDEKVLRSVCLQAGGQGPQLFLFPDGSGSCTAYASLHRTTAYSAIYGLQNPFLLNPDSWNCGIEGIVDLYIKEIRGLQPHGPYVLGGWSLGGILAFEAARKLILVGEQIARLILIDSPCPATLPPMSESLILQLESRGVIGESRLPPERRSMILNNFRAATRNLATYLPQRIPAQVAPLTTLISAKFGLGNVGEDKYADIAELKIRRWLLDDREDLDTAGWEQLLPQQLINFFMVKGNHFSMMSQENIGELSSLLSKV